MAKTESLNIALTDEMKKFAENSGVIFTCVSEEKGHWGSFELKDSFDV